MTDNTNSKTPRDGSRVSAWQTTGVPEVPAVSSIAGHYDVIVAGAGLSGMTTALLLQQQGKKCLVLEAASPGFGTTGGTTAHLNNFFDATYPEVESDFGEEAAALLARSGNEAMDQIKTLSARYGIDCDFEHKDAFLFSQDEQETKELDQMLAASQRAGVIVEEAAGNGTVIPFERAIRYENQAQFHPLKYLAGLVRAYQELGGELANGKLVTGTEVKDEKVLVSCGEETYGCSHFVYATHLPPGINQFSFKCAPYRSYVIGVTLTDGNYPEALIYDMKEPYHYLRTHEIDGQKYLIAGGEDHKTGHGDPEQSLATLRDYVAEHFRIGQIAFSWSSQYYVSVDGLPYIGAMPGSGDRIFTGTGFNGNGMIFGTLTGMIVSDLILGKQNPYAALFDPGRVKPVASFTEFVKEQADVAYHFIADRFRAEDLPELADLGVNEGKVVSYDGKKIAIYKDETGKVTALSPTCTHAGCIVDFNPLEKTWDCPCHGGRYDLQGRVITGPPQKALKQIGLDS
ncbi:oxidoreductase [Pedobacter yulinensis]|uniref:Oxidoreductase n=1 Tax=Pedobacter yulinensis TaxID=2126353 RepID=A0A2T3HK26_9SPHI|nr:FAD-dependent oxidoreductase [Pedobacter yulinensis]PST82818.1 oxidoreductase [Pedobacter yulinensis]